MDSIFYIYIIISFSIISLKNFSSSIKFTIIRHYMKYLFFNFLLSVYAISKLFLNLYHKKITRINLQNSIIQNYVHKVNKLRDNLT